MNYEEILQIFELETECPISKISDIDAAYIAGIVDGEGCISASVGKTTKGYSRTDVSLYIGTVDDKIIPYISNILQIKYKTYARGNLLQIRSSSLILLFVRIIPFLKLKDRQALLALELLYLLQNGKASRKKLNPEKHLEIVKEIQKLNQEYKNKSTSKCIHNIKEDSN